MPTSPQGHALATCFYYLREFQSACSFNTDTLAMSSLQFANQQIASILPSAPYQNQFLQAATANTGLLLSMADLTNNKLFLDLLNQYRPLQSYVGSYLMSLAVPPYPAGTLQAFFLASAASAFPGGHGAAQWSAVVAGLTSTNPVIIPADCFTTTLQNKVAALVDSAATNMSAVVGAIAGLG